jgi:enoyl-CoA hydratase/carnithine racemase
VKSIRIDVVGAVGTITIDRRERFNSLDVETARDLRKAGLQLARDNAIRAVVLRGNGGVFCSGADLKYIRGGGDAAGLGYFQPHSASSAPPRETVLLASQRR